MQYLSPLNGLNRESDRYCGCRLSLEGRGCWRRLSVTRRSPDGQQRAVLPCKTSTNVTAKLPSDEKGNVGLCRHISFDESPADDDNGAAAPPGGAVTAALRQHLRTTSELVKVKAITTGGSSRDGDVAAHAVHLAA